MCLIFDLKAFDIVPSAIMLIISIKPISLNAFMFGRASLK